jgi:hypothetical protein
MSANSELLQLLPTPYLRLLPLLLDISHCIGQDMGSLLSHLPSPVHLRKFTLEQGNLSDKAFCLLTSRG